MSNNQPDLNVKIPSVLTIKDLITIISIAVSLAAAWGVFGTRITVAEREIVALQNEIRAQQMAVDKLQQHTTRLTAHQQDDELLIDQLYTLMKKPIPVRRAIK